MQQPLREDMLTVKEIWEVFNRKISLRHIYILIERGELEPVFRFAGRYGTCVPREAVLNYKNRCQRQD